MAEFVSFGQEYAPVAYEAARAIKPETLEKLKKGKCLTKAEFDTVTRYRTQLAKEGIEVTPKLCKAPKKEKAPAVAPEELEAEAEKSEHKEKESFMDFLKKHDLELAIGGIVILGLALALLRKKK